MPDPRPEPHRARPDGLTVGQPDPHRPFWDAVLELIPGRPCALANHRDGGLVLNVPEHGARPRLTVRGEDRDHVLANLRAELEAPDA